MKTVLTYTTFETAMGWVGILGSGKGIMRITTGNKAAQEALNALGTKADNATDSPDEFKDITERFQKYFRGEPVVFPNEIDLSDATPFQRRVWQAAISIPYGETRSYGWIAKQIDNPKAARAVGQAMHRNPFSILVPCHRVVAGDGGIGGFGGGVEMKQRLLRMEGIIKYT